MIQVSWGTVATLVILVVAVGPGFFIVGRTSKQVDRNTEDIKSLFTKLDTIYQHVKNGNKPSP